MAVTVGAAGVVVAMEGEARVAGVTEGVTAEVREVVLVAEREVERVAARVVAREEETVEEATAGV